MPVKSRYSARDRIAAYLTLVIVFCMLALSVAALFMTGLFRPVVGTVSLSDTQPLPIQTTVPRATESAQNQQAEGGLLDWLFSSANAEATPPAEPTDLNALLEGIETQEKESEITDEDRVKVSKSDLSINTNLPSEWFNILLLATDSRDFTANIGRTDVMIVASINAATGEVKLSSLARDMYLPIPGISKANRLNAAYAFGNANLAMKTINHNFELNLQNYVLVNFSTMAAIIDSLGGIDIALEGDEYKQINENVAVSEDYEGFAKSTNRRQLTEDDKDTMVHLDGLQGVGYARIRKIDNDIHRSSRQRILLQAMLDKVMQNATLPGLINLFNSMSRTTETNLVITKIIELGGMLLLADDISIIEMSIPIPGSYSPSREKDSKGKDIDVLKVSLSQNVQALHEFIYGEYYPATPK